MIQVNFFRKGQYKGYRWGFVFFVEREIMRKFLLLLSSVCLLFQQTSIVSASAPMPTSVPKVTTTAIAGNDIKSEDEIKSFHLENAPNVNSEAAIVMEASTGAILYAKNIHGSYYPASITKILTTLVALENSSLKEVVTHSKKAIYDVDLKSSRIGIDVGEQLTMEQSLYGIMLESANEVSYAVGEHVSGDIDSFMKLMNERAKTLGALNSNFTNPHGLPDENHYTTAYDMAVIARAAIQNETFKKITQTRVFTIPPTNIQEETRYLANHHRFIKYKNQYEGCIGGKTGYTSVAKYTLVTFAERNGMTLISVIMKCDSIANEYSDTKALLDFGFDNFSLYNIADMEHEEDGKVLPSSLLNQYSPQPDKNQPMLQVTNGNVILPSGVSLDEAKKQIEFMPLPEEVQQAQTGVHTIGRINYIYNNIYIGSADITHDFSSYTPFVIKGHVSLPVQLSTIDDEPTKANVSIKDTKTIIIGILIGIVVLVTILYLVFIEIPYRRKRYHYKRKSARRKGTSIDF